TILDRIVERRRVDVRDAAAVVPRAALERSAASAPRAISFTGRLRAAGPMALIAEIKRASPSKGDIAPGMDAPAQSLRYAKAGAAGISVLTEPTWFKGTLDDLAAVRAAVDTMGGNRPAILRKDFIIDEYQVVEARVYGADALLLIVAALDDDTLARLFRFTGELGMESLVEVDTVEGMQRAVALGAPFIGINNRDLRSFTVDLRTTDTLATLAPRTALLAALSGIQQRADVERFAYAGAEAVLVGEALMLAGDPSAAVRELLGFAGSKS
ncbi:MAG: indole-3-glycerol phosphate synthase TrpC, partial [Caldilineaceae bacterium]|nr:indole-3-glycerol phosphate synthase TrpC [Caldilineaceae bacterium]